MSENVFERASFVPDIEAPYYIRSLMDLAALVFAIEPDLVSFTLVRRGDEMEIVTPGYRMPEDSQQRIRTRMARLVTAMEFSARIL